MGIQTGLVTKEKYPKIVAYHERLTDRDAYKRAIKRAEEASGEKYSMTFD